MTTHKDDQAGEVHCTIFDGEGLDDGLVGMVLRGAPLAQFGEELCPAVSMTPGQARKVAADLTAFALDAEAKGLERQLWAHCRDCEKTVPVVGDPRTLEQVGDWTDIVCPECAGIIATISLGDASGAIPPGVVK